MHTKTSRSKELLDKVYNHLDSIDVSKLSMGEMKDFLEVVQKGQFLETFGQAQSYGLGLCNGYASPFNGPGLGQVNAGVCEGDSAATSDE